VTLTVTLTVDQTFFHPASFVVFWQLLYFLVKTLPNLLQETFIKYWYLYVNNIANKYGTARSNKICYKVFLDKLTKFA